MLSVVIIPPKFEHVNFIDVNFEENTKFFKFPAKIFINNFLCLKVYHIIHNNNVSDKDRYIKDPYPHIRTFFYIYSTLFIYIIYILYKIIYKKHGGKNLVSSKVSHE